MSEKTDVMITPAGVRAALARGLLDCLLRQVMLDGTFHADPHPGNVLLLAEGRLGLLDFGPSAASTPGCARRCSGCCWPWTGATRPASPTRCWKSSSGPGNWTIPPEIAAVFRALATMEGTLTQLAPGFDIVAEARRFAGEQFTTQFSPDVLRKTAADELIALLPALRRLPRRIDRLGGALEAGRLSVNVRLLADPADRRYLTGLLHQVILVALAATSGVMAVLMLALRVLVLVFRPDTR
jgi:ubiquinone biosynthesis protein